jgi:hypothetical protein
MNKKYCKIIFTVLFFSSLFMTVALAQRPNFLADPSLGVSRERAQNTVENEDDEVYPIQSQYSRARTPSARMQMAQQTPSRFSNPPTSDDEEDFESTTPTQPSAIQKEKQRKLGARSQLPSPSEAPPPVQVNTTIPEPAVKSIKITPQAFSHSENQTQQPGAGVNNSPSLSPAMGNSTNNVLKPVVNTKPVIFLPSTNVIAELGSILTEIKSRVTMPVIFPTRIPVAEATTKYFVSSSASSNQQQYSIFIDTTPRCDGAHFCNMGTINAYNNGFPFIYYSMENKELTVPVMLTHNLKGYYTPAHPMADMWPTQLEWRDKNILYSITWQHLPTADEKQDIINIANSAINMGYR